MPDTPPTLAAAKAEAYAVLPQPAYLHTEHGFVHDTECRCYTEQQLLDFADATHTLRTRDGDFIMVRAADLRAMLPAEDGPEAVCAEAYQIVGLLFHMLGMFDQERSAKILDNLSQARRVHKDVLPWSEVETPQAAPQPAAQHPDDVAVDALAALMKAKLEKQRAKGYSDWDDPECKREWLSALLRKHVDKGDPVDVANFCAFLSARGWGIAPTFEASIREFEQIFGAPQPAAQQRGEKELRPLVVAIEDALDKAGAPIRLDNGHWLTFTERIAALAAQPQETAPVAQEEALPREDFAWMVVKSACETEPADEDDPECIRILRLDLKSAVLAAFLQHDATRSQQNNARAA